MPTDQELPAAHKDVRWYAVQTQPRREALALHHLRNQNFTAFCPMRRGPKRVGRHTLTALQPFFPGYVFVRLDLKRERWRSINGTVGILRIVTFGNLGRPTPLPWGLVEHFQAITAETGELRFRASLVEGDAVRVIGGPFDQLYGVLETAGHLERVVILLEVMSKATRVQVSREMLVAA